jgi:predicted ATPase
MKRVVLTGGPGSGKTVVSSAIAGADPARFVVVPEAATQIYSAAKTRWDLVDVLGRREIQRRIYHHQREQEERFAAEQPDKVLILDRGTIDGAAYWPDGPDAYWDELGTTLGAELARYDMVIWLQTAAAIGIYDGSASNAVRFEDAAGAVKSGEMLIKLWGGHPKFWKVEARPSLAEKIVEVRGMVERGMGVTK